MKIKDAVRALENFAPLPLQEDYDNAGLQIGLTERELSGALLCLDVTEDVVDLAISEHRNLIVAHHPLLFHGLKRISDENCIQRIVMKAIKHDITIYAAHTNLDNARDGVNFYAARLLGLTELEFLRPLPDGSGGSGVVGELPAECDAEEFVNHVKQALGAAWLMHNHVGHRKVKRVAMCMGAGAEFADDAVRVGADLFITGEMGHHRWFDYEGRIMICALGHYQSEVHVVDLLYDFFHKQFPAEDWAKYRQTDPEQLVVK